MTDREKVIKGLECCSAYDYRCNDCPYQDDGGAEDDCYSDELYADALALLIAQKPRVMTLETDLISRAAAIEALSTPCDKRYRYGVWETCLDNIETAIKHIPAVDVAPVVHAHWIETKIPANTTGHGGVGQDKKNGWLCSNCRCAFDAKLLWCHNYCPNCGAKMDGE